MASTIASLRGAGAANAGGATSSAVDKAPATSTDWPATSADWPACKMGPTRKAAQITAALSSTMRDDMVCNGVKQRRSRPARSSTSVTSEITKIRECSSLSNYESSQVKSSQVKSMAGAGSAVVHRPRHAGATASGWRALAR